jgi:hypothetical protein
MNTDESGNERAQAKGSETTSGDRILSPRKIVMQIVGFALGLALLIWCIVGAARGGDWSAVAQAPPHLVLGLMGCTLVSLAANGAIFWLVIRPVQPLRLRHLMLLNVTTAVLNYAPIRAGLIARIAYHLKVDRMPLMIMGGWFAAIGYTTVMAVAAVIVATLLQQSYQFSWFSWLAIVFGQIVAMGFVTIGLIGAAQMFLTPAFVQRVGRGMHRMLREPLPLWGALALRLVDIGAFMGRMWCAAAIIGLDQKLTGTQVALLGVTALVMTLFPLGRVGYREAGVALVAPYLVGINDIDAALKQLALLESAGEAIVAIPLGSLALLWYRKRWIAIRPE